MLTELEKKQANTVNILIRNQKILKRELKNTLTEIKNKQELTADLTITQD